MAWIVGAIVAVNLVLYGLSALFPAPGGKPSSSLATTPRGFSAWAELAQRNGVRVVALRQTLRRANLPRGATVVALDVPRLSRKDAAALRAFARDGGHVVAGGRDPSAWVGVFDDDLSWREAGAKQRTADDLRLQTAGAGEWIGDGLVTDRGNVRLLADSSPLQNGRIAKGDNAAFALDLAGHGPLVFAEAAHGYGEATGIGALPGPAKGALALLLVAALLFLVSRGKRFGPVEPAARALAPARVEYVDAIAGRLVKTGDVPGAMEPLRAALEAEPPRDDHEAIALARRYAELQGSRR